MADEPTQAPAEDEQATPAPEETQDTSVETPESPETDATESTDYEKRYHDLQPEYTRATQEAAQLRQIIALAQQGDPEARELLGWESQPEQDTEDDDYDPESPMTQAQFQEYLSAQQQEQEAAQSEQAFMSDFAADLDAIEKQEGRSLTDWEKNVLFNDAQGQVARSQTYDLEAPWKEISDYHKSVIEDYSKSKKSATLAPLGSAGDEKIDLSNDEARADRMAAIMEAASAAEAE